MKSLRNRVLAIVVFALAGVFAGAVPVSAQSAAKGSFTLYHQVRWHNAMLEPGDYTFEIKSLAGPMVLKGPNGAQFISALFVSGEKPTNQSMLVVENRGSESFVRELRLGPVGCSLRYSVPKAPKDIELAKVTREHILVATK